MQVISLIARERGRGQRRGITNGRDCVNISCFGGVESFEQFVAPMRIGNEGLDSSQQGGVAVFVLFQSTVAFHVPHFFYARSSWIDNLCQ